MRATCRNCDFGSGPGNTEGTKKALQFGSNSGTRVDLSPMNRASVFFLKRCTTLIPYKFCVVDMHSNMF